MYEITKRRRVKTDLFLKTLKKQNKMQRMIWLIKIMLIPNEGQVCSQDNNAMAEEIILLTYKSKQIDKHIKSTLEGLILYAIKHCMVNTQWHPLVQYVRMSLQFLIRHLWPMGSFVATCVAWDKTMYSLKCLALIYKEDIRMFWDHQCTKLIQLYCVST